MKQTKFHRAIVAIAMMLIGWLPSLAHDFEVDGVFYNVISTTEVEVTYKGSSYNEFYSEYKGSVVIPSLVEYGGFTYSVTSIGEGAFYKCRSLTNIEIPNSVTSIGNSAFYECLILTSIEIPNSVTSIGVEAFRDCTSLTSIEIPNSVTSIGEGAFRDCDSLTDVVIGNSVTSIGINAFRECKSLTSIEIPNSVTSIGDSAFRECKSLTSVVIGNSVTSIGNSAFYGCDSLTSIVVDAGNSKYDSRNGCNAIIETASNTLITGCQNTIIPNSVTSIGNSAFSSCKSLTSIEIPNSVTSIGDGAFSHCSSLTSIEIPNSVTSIGNSSFSSCKSLTSVVIGNSVTSIGDDAFRSCSSLTSVEIGNSVTSIGEWAFYYCTSLTSIEIPNSVTSIGIYAFEGCTSLTSIEIPNSVTNIGINVFWGCSSLTDVVIGNSVTRIGINTFRECSSLTSVVIGNSVTSIGDNAFSGCSSLTSVVWNAKKCSDFSSSSNPFPSSPNITSFTFGDEVEHIPAYLCYNLSKLTSVVIGNSVTSIGNNAFDGCSSLTGIEIPNSVTSIGERAFYYCYSLTSIEIPNSVTSIGNSAFSGCTSLTSVVWNAKKCSDFSSSSIPFKNSSKITSFTFGDEVEHIPAYLCYNLSKLPGIEIPNSVTSIGDYAFEGCTSLTSVVWNAKKCSDFSSSDFSSSAPFENCSNITSFTFGDEVEHIPAYLCYNLSKLPGIEIPNSVTSIGDRAFYYCSSLPGIEIPNSVTSIGDRAFWGCTSLPGIEIPNSVTSIGDGAFGGCSSLTSVVWNAKKCSDFSSSDFSSPVPFENCSNITSFTFGDEVEHIPACLCYKLSKLPSIEIPNSVTSIGEWAFGYCTSLPSIEIPNSVTSIGDSAFSCCSGLTSVVIGNSVTSIGEWAFDGCSSLTSIEIPNSVTSIGYAAFSGCSSLTSIEIPNSVTSIGDGAFAGCSGLTSIVVDSGNTKYDSRNGCNAIIETASNTLITGCQNTIIPNSVTSIGDYAFYYCSNLTSIEIPNSVTSIRASAFTYCTSLTSIEIPNSVTSIGDRAFSYCSSLPGIEIPNSVTSIGNYTFYKCTSLTSIQIPNSVTSIGEWAFADCSSLTSIEIPNSVTSIGDYAFADCSSLTSIEIPNSVTSIGEDAFQSCSSLTSIQIGNSVTSIGNYAFWGCSSLTKVTCLAINPPMIDSLTFLNYSAELYVPVGCISAYQSANYWKKFNIKELPIILSTFIALNKTSASLKATETLTLVATVLPETATNKSVIWTSSNEAVATVDENGVVTAVALGEAVITATTTDGTNLSASCQVTVVPTLAETITLDKTGISLEATETATLVATVLSELTTNKSVTWTSSNEAVATVDANGVVTAVAVGEAVIKVTTTDGSNLSASCKVTVVSTLAETITLDKTEISLEATETATLVATVLPELTTNKSVTWTSSNEAVATVDANGVVTAIAVGEATITATTTDGSDLSASCKVTVVPTLAETIALDKTEISLEATETATLVATVLPETATNKSVTWTSSNEAVATVDANGVVTAIALGEAVITATTTDGTNLSATCKVTVVPTMAETITLDKTEIRLEANETATLVATVLPELTTDKSVKWSSSDETVAIVDENGVVTAVAVGEATITATTVDDSNLSASCQVTVIPTLAVSIELDQTEASVEEKSDLQLTATILPEHATNKEVAWSSSDKWVATVDNTGLVTIHSAGEVIITATTTDGTNLSATCRINVYSGIDGVNGNDVIVATIGDNIVVKNAKLGSNVRVYAADGSIITSEIATDGDVVVEAPVKGIYIVAIDGKSFKVMVK